MPQLEKSKVRRSPTTWAGILSIAGLLVLFTIAWCVLDYQPLNDVCHVQEHKATGSGNGSWQPQFPPAGVATGLKDPAVPYTMTLQWSLPIPRCCGIATGNWHGNGQDDILVTDRNMQLHVIDLTGHIKYTMPSPQDFTRMEVSGGGPKNVRLVGYEHWGKRITVLDANGIVTWEYLTPKAINGAHWGDLDGDEIDELVIGLNADGIQALSADGNLIWSVDDIACPWNQAIVSYENSRECFVFSTDANWQICMYSSTGLLIKTLKPYDGCFTEMSAAVVDSIGTIQVIANANGLVVTLDPEGKIFWSTAGFYKHQGWRRRNFSCGDMDGDGVKDWLFRDDLYHLTVVSADGYKLSSLPADYVIDFAVATVPNDKAYFIAMRQGRIDAYKLVPAR